MQGQLFPHQTCSFNMFVSVVGFPPEQSKSPSSSTHRGVRRQRSLLSESLRSNSVLSMSRENSLSSMGSAELVGSYTSISSTSESEDSCEQLQQHIGESQFGESTAVPIPYTRSVDRPTHAYTCVRVRVRCYQHCRLGSDPPNMEKQKALRLHISSQWSGLLFACSKQSLWLPKAFGLAVGLRRSARTCISRCDLPALNSRAQHALQPNAVISTASYYPYVVGWMRCACRACPAQCLLACHTVPGVGSTPVASASLQLIPSMVVLVSQASYAMLLP